MRRREINGTAISGDCDGALDCHQAEYVKKENIDVQSSTH